MREHNVTGTKQRTASRRSRRRGRGEKDEGYVLAMFALLLIPILIATALAGLAMMALANAQETKDALKAATEAAVARGVFGAPTFFVNGTMFWGQDRLDFVREALTTS